MDSTYLMLSMLFGTIGFGFIIYSRKAGVIVPAVAGVGLTVLPWFISNVWLLVIVCGVLTTIPFVIRDI